ncbi:hypothetical protein ACQP1V_13000 [Microtetraspora malaysiensis]|uniref:hypothetical protein n=1 Tax=Microtetraspora malaysiensis TaxID=161358 RepID=UPI003D8C2157
MSEVVPLPSFGEVFFDARGQDRVLRVTWHEGTLVLSLWRGEMCTASFRMPMADVGRLIDTLDDGFTEAGGQYDEEPGTGPLPQVNTGEYPGTGQYQRPQLPDQGYPPQQGQEGYGAADQGAAPYQQEPQAPAYAQAGPDGGYGQADDGYAQQDGGYGYADGGYGHPDGGYGRADAGYDQQQPEGGYPDNGYGQQDGGYPQAGPDYGRPGPEYGQPEPDYGRQGGEYGQPEPDYGRPEYGQPEPDYGKQPPYQQEPAPAAVGPNDVLVARGNPGRDRRAAAPTDSVPRENLIVGDSLPYDPTPPGYGQYDTGQYDTAHYETGRYEPPGQYDRDQNETGRYEPPGQYDRDQNETGRYERPGQYDPQPRSGDPSGGGYEPGEPVYQFPSPVPGRPAYRFDPEPYPQQGQPQQGQQQPQPGQPQAAPSTGVDPNDPLGLGTPASRQTDPSLTRPYVQDPMYSTGERTRPEPRDERDW